MKQRNPVDPLAALEAVRAAERQFGGRGRNPERSQVERAAELASEWYGRPSRSIREIDESIRSRDVFVDLARLVELEIIPLGSRSQKEVIPLAFDEKENVRLMSSPPPPGRKFGDQIYFSGPVYLDEATLRAFGLDKAEIAKDLIVLGEVHLVAYHAAKWTAEHKPDDYGHTFAEVRGFRPQLVWNRVSRELLLAGGSYTVEDRGIVN